MKNKLPLKRILSDQHHVTLYYREHRNFVNVTIDSATLHEMNLKSVKFGTVINTIFDKVSLEGADLPDCKDCTFNDCDLRFSSVSADFYKNNKLTKCKEQQIAVK
jgi:uncharacterized protein YjbI with pentapeptide repeats